MIRLVCRFKLTAKGRWFRSSAIPNNRRSQGVITKRFDGDVNDRVAALDACAVWPRPRSRPNAGTRNRRRAGFTKGIGR
jgi:hypothetical protein